MYEQYFGLNEPPFSLTPDTQYVYRHAGHQEAVNELLSALQAGEGFVAVTAEVGSGKTLLCRKLLTLLPAHWVSAYLPNPLLTPLELYRAIAMEIGLDAGTIDSLQDLQQQIFCRLVEVHTAGGQAIVMIDEAQAMSQQSLEALRLLSNLETEKKKLLQVVFFAQPELEKRLEQHSLRQLRQRITYVCHLRPMCKDDIEGYLRHRLAVSGYNGPVLFSTSAVKRIYRSTQGSPRLINILAHKALLVAYGQGVRRISSRQVGVAIADTVSVQGPNLLGLNAPLFWLGLFTSLLVSILIVLLLKGALT